MDRVHDLDRRVSGLRDLAGLNAPDSRDVFAAGRIGNMPLPGELIAFLAVFAATLAISLAGDHIGSRAFSPDVAGGETEVDHREAIFHAVRMVFHAAGMKCHGTPRFTEPARRFFDGGGRDT